MTVEYAVGFGVLGPQNITTERSPSFAHDSANLTDNS